MNPEQTQYLTMQEAVEQFYCSMDGILAPTTVRFYHDRLPSLLAFLGPESPVNQITIQQLRQWRSSLVNRTGIYQNRNSSHPPVQKHLAPATIHQYVRSTKRLFRWLFLEGYTETNPAARLELPQLPSGPGQAKSISARDVLKLLEAAQTPRDRALILVLCDTAARVGGIASLTLDDIDFEQGMATVHEKGKGGSGKYRHIFFTDATIQALAVYLPERKAAPGVNALFTNKSGQPLTTSGLREILRRISKLVGIKRANPHSFRHGAIRAMLNSGMSLPAASQIAGHSSVTITGDIYGRVSETQLRALHNQHSWVNQLLKKE